MGFMSQLFLATFSIIVLVPAWRLYLLPMAIHDGWKFGFLIENLNGKWHEIHEHAKDRDIIPSEFLLDNKQEQVAQLRRDNMELRSALQKATNVVQKMAKKTEDVTSEKQDQADLVAQVLVKQRESQKELLALLRGHGKTTVLQDPPAIVAGPRKTKRGTNLS